MGKGGEKSTERELKESEIFYRHLAELTPDAIVIHSNGKIIYANPSSAKFVGAKTNKELIGKPIMQFVHPDSRAVVMKRIRMMMEKKKPVPPIIEKFLTMHGSVLVAEVKSVPFLFHGHPAFLAIMRDITEWTLREERDEFLNKASEVLMSSLDYQMTLKHIAQLIVPFMADYCRIAVVEENGHMHQVGVNHADKKKVALVKKLFDEYKDQKSTTHGVGRILQTGKPEMISRMTPDVYETVDNSKILEITKKLGLKSYMGIPLKARGKIIGAVTFSSSREGRHYSKKDLAFAQELGHRLAYALDNSHLLANEQKAVRLRDDFLSVASHELKTPVTSLKAFAQVMQARLTNAGDLQNAMRLGKMDAQINKLTTLIQDLLDATKIQSGKLQLHMDSYSMRDLLTEIVEEIQRTTNHPLVVGRFSDGKMYGDKERIGQVLSNLLTNAIKYSPESKPIIIKSEKRKSDLVCSVQDFGIGISAHQIPFIFERFYREIGKSENTFPGLGLGLYISSEIIRRHDGKIWVNSKKGEGSTFYFSLPLH